MAQSFSLPENIIYYFRQNVTNHLVLMNLQRTCKYFSFYYKIVELKNLSSSSKFLEPLKRITTVRMGKRKKKITEEQLLSSPVHYAFTGKLYIDRPSLPLLTSQLLSKALITNIWKVVLSSQILTLKEYEFLTVNTFSITLDFCNIYDENRQVVPALRLIPWDSNFIYFNFFSDDDADYPNETFQELTPKRISNLSKRKVGLVFWYLPLYFDPTSIVKFLMNNQSKNLTVELGFGPGDDQLGEDVQAFVNEQLKDLPKEKKPNVKITFF